eukprot:GHRQ01028192.1.p1 GENE.GHRQ01028192.1~~GHRQ01028192.1.p1  ORF type:complete len:320 (+),score=96.49 GHRQ01028192.1:316-1275(+)
MAGQPLGRAAQGAACAGSRCELRCWLALPLPTACMRHCYSQARAAVEQLAHVYPAATLECSSPLAKVVFLGMEQVSWGVANLLQHRLTPLSCLPADLLHEYMDHMHSAQPRLSAVCSCVEEYVEKLVFLAELTQLSKVMDAACAQVHAVYALLDEYKIKVPDVDRAGYASLDSTYAALKALMEEVEAGREEAVAKYSAGLELGVEGLAKEVEALRAAAQNETLLDEDASPAAVLDELQALRAQLAAHAEELARVNQFQRLFKVLVNHHLSTTTVCCALKTRMFQSTWHSWHELPATRLPHALPKLCRLSFLRASLVGTE